MIITKEKPGISPAFELTRAAASVALSISYTLEPYLNEETGLFEFAGEILAQVGDTIGGTFQDADAPIGLNFSAPYVTGVTQEGAYEMVDHNSGANVLFAFSLTVFDAAAHFAGGFGSDIVFGSEEADVIKGGCCDDFLEGAGGDDKLSGGVDRDSLFGGLGDDILRGGADGDLLAGGRGKDTASYASAGSGVVANLGSPIDNAGDAAGDRYRKIENLHGSKFDDILVGDAGNNELRGSAGDDELQGGEGRDHLSGGVGVDTLIGGAGKDRQSGGEGGDVFVYWSATDSQAGEADFILDFEQGIDRFDLGSIDASIVDDGDQAFSFVGSAAFSGEAGELRTFGRKGNTYVAADLDGDALTDFILRVQGDHTLTIDDFVL